MDRRTFLSRAGTLGAAWPAFAAADGTRDEGLARAAGAPLSTGVEPPALALGYLRASPALLTRLDAGEDVESLAGRLRWQAWRAGEGGQVFPADRLAVSIGLLRRAEGGPLDSLAITAHFAIEGTRDFAAFPAWRDVAGKGSRGASTSPPIGFTVPAPRQVALQVDYGMGDRKGTLAWALGGHDGPNAGLFVIAGPSRATGRLPNLASCAFSGDANAPLVLADGRAPDFDYLPVAIRPVAG